MVPRSHAITHPGLKHTENEDNVFADDARGFYIVSDGVGSYRGAAMASRLAVEAASRALDSKRPEEPRELKRWLGRTVQDANAAMREEAKRDPSRKSMAATLTLLYLVGNEFYIVHVGDSRLYRRRSGRLDQITRDHTVAFEQFEIGAITKEQMQTHPNQKLITRTLGNKDFVAPDIIEGGLQPGDRFLLCTDGLTKELTDARIAEIMGKETPPDALCAELVDQALQSGGKDNITVIAVHIP